MRCPFCEADDAERISLFGSQLLLSQYRCGACGTYFEGLRDDRLEGEQIGDNDDEHTPRGRGARMRR